MANDDEWAKRAFDRQDNFHHELVKASLDSAREAIRAALILNGAACIALLGFLASVVSNQNSNIATSLIEATKNGLMWFASGAVLAVITAGFSYIANSLYGAGEASKTKTFEHPYVRENKASARFWFWGRMLNWIAVVVLVLSYVVFICGLWRVGAQL
jgi:hypothetical protein